MRKCFNEEEIKCIRSIRSKQPDLNPIEVAEKFRERYQREISPDTIKRYCGAAGMAFDRGRHTNEGDNRLYEAYKKTNGNFNDMLDYLNCKSNNLARRLRRGGFKVTEKGNRTEIIAPDDYKPVENR